MNFERCCSLGRVSRRSKVCRGGFELVPSSSVYCATELIPIQVPVSKLVFSDFDIQLWISAKCHKRTLQPSQHQVSGAVSIRPAAAKIEQAVRLVERARLGELAADLAQEAVDRTVVPASKINLKRLCMTSCATTHEVVFLA